MFLAVPNTARRLVLIMVAVVVTVTLVSRQYYKGQNRWIDPRVVPARELYAQYNQLAEANDLPAVLSLLNEVDSIYNQYPHYYQSYELGVLENNRAAVYLTMMVAAEEGGGSKVNLDSLAALAEAAVRNSISIYETWIARHGEQTEEELRVTVREDFLWDLETGKAEESRKYLSKRTEELLEAQREVPRRLSVAYTNLGVVYRYHEDYEGAAAQYRKALSLWEDNLSAENNLNHLLGQPLRKRSVFRKLFPRER